jgi:hypothetical protein
MSETEHTSARSETLMSSDPTPAEVSSVPTQLAHTLKRATAPWLHSSQTRGKQ